MIGLPSRLRYREADAGDVHVLLSVLILRDTAPPATQEDKPQPTTEAPPAVPATDTKLEPGVVQ